MRREELDDGGGCSHLADPKEEHPLDHFGLEFRAILLGHEAFREVVLLLAKSHFEALCNGAGLERFDAAGGFEDREDFDRADEEE